MPACPPPVLSEDTAKLSCRTKAPDESRHPDLKVPDFAKGCDETNNPSNVIAANGLGFDLFFKRDGKSFQLNSAELIRAHLAGMLW